MNEILREKLNINIIDIVREYLLPIKNTNRKIFKQLISKTWNILYNLNINACLDDKTNFYVDDLKNVKIKRIFNSMTDDYYWSIRKIKTDI